MSEPSSLAGASAAASSNTSSAPASGGKDGLSNAERKKLQKAEKQAKRAARKEADGAAPTSQPPAQQSPQAPQDKKQQLQQKSQQAPKGPPPAKQAKGLRGPVAPQHRGLEYFKNLAVKDLSDLEAPECIHEKVLIYVEQMLDGEFQGSTARCSAMLEVFKAVISDYEAPEGNTLSRHFIPECLSKQVDYIKEFRPLSIGMSNIVKHLEAAAVKVDPSLSIQQAKEQLIANLDDYLINRIMSPDTLITKRVAAEIKDGDVVLTYGNSSLVSKTLTEAHHLEKQFRVIIVDSNPQYEGRILASNLLEAGLKSEYYTLSNISHAIAHATKVLIGTQGILNDGRLYARAGTAVIAMHADSQDVPLIVCSQSFKFSDEASVDAFARNELAPLEDFLDDEDLQKKWKDKSNALPLLRIVNPLYDLTPSRYVSVVACEFGCLAVEKVPEIYALVDQSQNSQDI